jgi:cullin 1
MILFKYIWDKDVFHTFYTTKLSRRLIHGVSASDEAEASMIAKLKEACGFEYIRKSQLMFTEISLSKAFNDQFKEKMAQTHTNSDDIHFSVKILGSNVRPLTPPTDKFVIPEDLLPTYERFTQYYRLKNKYATE